MNIEKFCQEISYTISLRTQNVSEYSSKHIPKHVFVFTRTTVLYYLKGQGMGHVDKSIVAEVVKKVKKNVFHYFQAPAFIFISSIIPR